MAYAILFTVHSAHIPLQNSHLLRLTLRTLGEHDCKDTISHRRLDALLCVDPGWEIDAPLELASPALLQNDPIFLLPLLKIVVDINERVLLVLGISDGVSLQIGGRGRGGGAGLELS